ncbi:MAG TPA: hypothetical protein VIF88_06890 [Methylocystis sp.]
MVVANRRRLSFIRFGDRFSSPFVFLVSLEALDEPVIDGNFLAGRWRSAAPGLSAHRFCALFLLPAPESFSDPIISGSVVSAARLGDGDIAIGRVPRAASPLVFAAFKGAEGPIAFENFVHQNSSPLTGSVPALMAAAMIIREHMRYTE